MLNTEEGKERFVSAVLLLLFLLIVGGTARFVFRQTRLSDADAAASIPSAPPRPTMTAPERVHHQALIAPSLLNLADLKADIRKFYPDAERRAGREGHVTLALVVEADGTVSGADVQSSGGADFDAAARKAALLMRFSPARKAGKAVAVKVSETIDFVLGE